MSPKFSSRPSRAQMLEESLGRTGVPTSAVMHSHLLSSVMRRLCFLVAPSAWIIKSPCHSYDIWSAQLTWTYPLPLSSQTTPSVSPFQVATITLSPRLSTRPSREIRVLVIPEWTIWSARHIYDLPSASSKFFSSSLNIVNLTSTCCGPWCSTTFPCLTP